MVDEFNGEKEVSTVLVIAVPAAICIAMTICALVVVYATDMSFPHLYSAYVGGSTAVTILCALGVIFVFIARLARVNADHPLQTLKVKAQARLVLMLLPTIIFPAFLAAFTASKTGISLTIGFKWDWLWASADRVLFGDDAWRITHRWLGTSSMVAWQWIYTVAWATVLVFAKSLVAILGRPSRVFVFYVSMMLTWFLGGFVLAYAFSAAGPAFVYLIDPMLAHQFAPLKSTLSQSLPENAPILATQTYLASAIDSHIAVRGGGISAMPSMHVGAASIYVLASRGSRWFIPAITFWALIFVGSAYFGYHYWIDGIVAAAVAAASWKAAEMLADRAKSAPKTSCLSTEQAVA